MGKPLVIFGAATTNSCFGRAAAHPDATLGQRVVRGATWGESERGEAAVGRTCGQLVEEAEAGALLGAEDAARG